MLARDPRRLFLRYRKKGDAAALGRVFDIVAPELLALAIHVTGDVAAAEDAVQDTFLVAVEGADRYDANRPFVPWLVGILVNRARKSRDLRRDTRVRSADDTSAPLDAVAAVASRSDPAHEVAAREVHDMVQRAVGALSEPYRAVVDKHLSECAPPRDIALALGRAPGTVRVQLHRGLEQLRGLLGGTGSESARERLSGLGLAIPAALRLSPDIPAQLATMREVVVQAGVTHGATSAQAVGGSTVPMALVGGVLGVCVLAVVALRLTAETDSEGTLVDNNTVHIAAVDPGDGAPQLAPIEPRRRPRGPEPAVRTAPPPVAPASAPTATRSDRVTSSAPRERDVTPELEEFDFYVEPMLDLRLVDDMNADQRAEFQARTVTGGTLASTHGSLVGLTQIKVGSHPSPDDLGTIIIRIDHPGALPVEAAILPQDWFPLGSDYAVRPTVVFHPIRATVRVLTHPSGPRAFHGLVQLRTFDDEGSHHYDTRPIERRDGRTSAVLRVPQPRGQYAIFALSSDPGISAQVIMFRGQRDAEVTLELLLESIRMPELQLEIVDPFGDPVTDAIVLGTVIDEAIVVRAGPESTPVVVDGWVICAGSQWSDFAVRSTNKGRIPTARDAKGRAVRLGMMPALRVIEGKSMGKGRVHIVGAHPGLYGYTIQTALNDEGVPGSIDDFDARRPRPGRRAYQVRAPIGGLEIVAPGDVLSDPKGPKAWQRARILVKAGTRELSGKVDVMSRARVLVPPSTPLIVQIEVPGFGLYEAIHRGIGGGSTGAVIPKPLGAPDPKPDRPDGGHADDGTGAGGKNDASTGEDC